jgi:hypothetical protein
LVSVDTDLSPDPYNWDDDLAGQSVAPVHRNIQDAGYLVDLHQLHPSSSFF